jgi:outer membrane protein assembly factor BamB
MQSDLRTQEAYQHSDISSTLPSDWPSLFGPNRDSTTETRINPLFPAEGPLMLWEVMVGTGYGSLVVADGRIVFNHRVDDLEWLQCHSTADGDLLWKNSTPTTAECDFEYSNGPYSTPIIDSKHNRVFNVTAQGVVQCFRFDNGKTIWARNLHQEYDVEPDIFPVGAGLYLDRETKSGLAQLIFNLGAYDKNAGIVALSVIDGKTIWQATADGPSYATPVVASLKEQRFAFVLTDEGLVCLDPDSGEVDWQITFRSRGDLSRNATSPLVMGDKVVIMTNSLGAMCIRVKPDRSFERVWRQRRTIDSQYNTVIAGENEFYSFTAGGQGGAEFRCIDLANGELNWSYHSVLKRGMGLATPDAFFILGEKGHLATLRNDGPHSQPQVLSFTAEPLMSEPCYCSPAIDDDCIYLKNEDRVAAYRLGNLTIDADVEATLSNHAH